MVAPGNSPLPPAVARQNLEKGLGKLAHGLADQSPSRLLDPVGNPYRLIAPRDCQCEASRNAPLAGVLDQERASLHRGGQRISLFCCRQQENRELQEIVLLNTALEIRNQAAGTAMEAYYLLAGAEARAELLQESLAQVEQAVTRTREFQTKGLKPPIDPEVLKKQALELQADQAQNQLEILRLNGQLQRALSLDGDESDPWRIWPDLALDAAFDPQIDIDQAVAYGLQVRPQLVLLREVEQRLNRRTLSTVRGMMGSIHVLLGGELDRPTFAGLAALSRILRVGSQISEVRSMRNELQSHLRDQERVAASEIRQAVHELHARRQLVLMARERQAHAQTRLKEVVQLKQRGLATYAEELTIALEVTKARGEVVREWLQWQNAEVKVRQAQGILPLECGAPNTICSKKRH